MARATFELEAVDLKTKRTASGSDFNEVTRKGYVPALVLDNGEILTENIAVLDWIAAQYPVLGVPGNLGRTRVLEALAFISTEVHRAFKPMWHHGDEVQKARARTTISKLLSNLADDLEGDYFSAQSPAWQISICSYAVVGETVCREVPEPLIALRHRVASRPAVQAAMRHEGLIWQTPSKTRQPPETTTTQNAAQHN